jgi:hypothetical protein
MLGRFTIAEYALFGEDILRILREFDAYVRNEPAQGLEPTAARFAALHGKELNFSDRSLVRWLALRRRYGARGSTSSPLRGGVVGHAKLHDALRLVKRRGGSESRPSGRAAP